MSAAKKSNAKKPVTKTAEKKPVPKTGPAHPAPLQKKRKGHLGKGLGALIGRTEISSAKTPAVNKMPEPSPPKNAVIDVPAAEIQRSPWQPRQSFDQEALHELAESIKTNGVIQPLICRKNADNRYELIAGERRLRASMEAELKKVPVILIDAEDRQAAEMAIVENIQRQDLNIIEEAEGYRALSDRFDLTQQEVADRVGKARASVANTLRLLELPDEVKQLVGSKLLSPGHAKVILSIPEPSEQVILGRKCVSDGMTVRNLEKLIRHRQAEANAPAKQPGKPDLPQDYVHNLTDQLHNHFGTAVRLTPGVTHSNGNHTKGVLEIDFYDNDDLSRILDVLGVTLD